MAKKITGYVKLQIPAGKANPSPPVGPALGQHGVNIMEFCKSFNARTQGIESMMTPVLIKKAAGLALVKKPGSGSKQPNKVKVGSITKKQVREIATQKMPDLNTTNIESAMRTVAGTARSMGVDVTE